jgi:membrane protein DedA with SNARE-associated domain
VSHFLNLLVSWGPLGVFVLSTVESAGIPNPGGTDWLLLVVSIARPGDALLSALLAIVGSFLGSVVLFEIGRKGGEKLLLRVTSGGRGGRFRAWFHRYGLATVFVSALVPVPIFPFKVFVLCAGALFVSRSRFLLVLTAARIPRYIGLAYLGAHLGQSSLTWASQHKWELVGFAALLFVTLYGLIRWTDRTRGFLGALE